MIRHSRSRCLREARALLKLAELADVVPRIGFDSSVGGKIDLSIRSQLRKDQALPYTAMALRCSANRETIGRFIAAQ